MSEKKKLGIFDVQWNIPGHGVIAKLAFDDILPTVSAQARTDIKTLLAADPVGRDSLIAMAQWPDIIRNDAAWKVLADAHVTDHYVNYAFDPDHPNQQPAAIGNGTLISELPVWFEKLKTEQDPELRGHALAYVTHLFGDIHQPHHTAACVGAYFPSNKFPDGDRGGNQTWWGASGKMHSFWDGLVVAKNDQASFDDAYNTARAGLDPAVLTAHPSTKFTDWALESYALAKESYQKFFAETTDLGVTQRGDSKGHLFAAPSDEYRAWAKAKAFDQTRLAAYRLAAALADAFAP